MNPLNTNCGRPFWLRMNVNTSGWGTKENGKMLLAITRYIFTLTKKNIQVAWLSWIDIRFKSERENKQSQKDARPLGETFKKHAVKLCVLFSTSFRFILLAFVWRADSFSIIFFTISYSTLILIWAFNTFFKLAKNVFSGGPESSESLWGSIEQVTWIPSLPFTDYQIPFCIFRTLLSTLKIF